MDKKTILGLFGGPAKTAAALKIKTPSVSEWGDVIPFSAIGRIAAYHPKLMIKLLREQIAREKQNEK